MENRDSFLVRQPKSFGHALNGIFYSFKIGFHFKVQVAALILAIILGYIYKISAFEWIILILISASVIAAEAANTAIEETCNLLHPELHPHARIAKHCAAGAVLILSVAAAIIGTIIFLPKIFS